MFFSSYSLLLLSRLWLYLNLNFYNYNNEVDLNKELNLRSDNTIHKSYDLYELISKSIGAIPTIISLLFVFKILIFHKCSSINLSNSFSHIVPIHWLLVPVLVKILFFSPVTIYFLFSFILFGHFLKEIWLWYILPNFLIVSKKSFKESIFGLNLIFIIYILTSINIL